MHLKVIKKGHEIHDLSLCNHQNIIGGLIFQ